MKAIGTSRSSLFDEAASAVLQILNNYRPVLLIALITLPLVVALQIVTEDLVAIYFNGFSPLWINQIGSAPAIAALWAYAAPKLAPHEDQREGSGVLTFAQTIFVMAILTAIVFGSDKIFHLFSYAIAMSVIWSGVPATAVAPYSSLLRIPAYLGLVLVYAAIGLCLAHIALHRTIPRLAHLPTLRNFGRCSIIIGLLMMAADGASVLYIRAITSLISWDMAPTRASQIFAVVAMSPPLLLKSVIWMAGSNVAYTNYRPSR